MEKLESFLGLEGGLVEEAGKKGSNRLKRVLYGILWERVRNILFASVLFDTI